MCELQQSFNPQFVLCTATLLISTTSPSYYWYSRKPWVVIVLAFPRLVARLQSWGHLPFHLQYYDWEPASLACISISLSEAPFLLPSASDFIHTLSTSRGVCTRLSCACKLYRNLWLLLFSLATVEPPSSVSSDGVLLGRGHARSKASGSPYRLFPIDWGPIATCFQWLGRSHLKNGPRVGMQAAIRAK